MRKTLAISGVFLIFIFVCSVYATWYTVNNDPQLNDYSSWGVDIWHESSTYVHDYYISGGEAYTRFKTVGADKWGNTEYEQGIDPWGTYGATLTEIPANYPIRVISRSKTLYESADFFSGRMNQYIEFWLTHPTGDGTYGYDTAEVMIILDSYGWLHGAEVGQNQYWARTAYDEWYFVGYRHWNMGSDWVYRETNVNSILNKLSTDFGCNLSEWTINCICFGVEGVNGDMRVQWDYIYYDVAM